MESRVKSLKQLAIQAYLKHNPDLLDRLCSDEENNKLTVEFEKPIPNEIRSMLITYAPLSKKTVIMQRNMAVKIHDEARANECTNFIKKHGVHENLLQIFCEGIKFGWNNPYMFCFNAKQQYFDQLNRNTIERIQKNENIAAIEPNDIKHSKFIELSLLTGWAIGDELYDSKRLVCESLIPIMILSTGFYLSNYFL